MHLNNKKLPRVLPLLLMPFVLAVATPSAAQDSHQHQGHDENHEHNPAHHAEHASSQSGYGGGVELSAAARAQIDAAKAAIQANYGSPEQAEAAGWRRPRSSTPTMGEHWSNPQLVRQGGFDPEKPEILMYAPINGELTLVGASWMNRQAADAEVPPLFDGLDNWHRHDATDALNQAQAALALANGRQPRQQANGIVMNHLWFIDAQQGEFTGHNHWLPFMDADLPLPPAAITGELLGKAAVALGEVNGSAFIVETYYQMLPGTAQEEVNSHRDAIKALIPAYHTAHSGGELASIEAVLAEMVTHWEQIRAIHDREFEPEVANLLNVAYGNMISADEHSADGHGH